MLVIFMLAFLCTTKTILCETNRPIFGSLLHSGLSKNVLPYKFYQMGPFWSYPLHKEYKVKYSPLMQVSLNRRVQKREAGQNSEETELEGRTRPDYKNAGLWAKGKTPVREIDLDWVPLQIYSQVRRYDSEKHLPREAAILEAKTPEEVINAPRLREVITHKKIQQVYEEEGFEDSGYDHGGYNHQGAHYEDIDKREAEAAKALPQKSDDTEMNSAESSVTAEKVTNQIHLSNLPRDKVDTTNNLVSSEEIKNRSIGSDKESSKVILQQASLQLPLLDYAERRVWPGSGTTYTANSESPASPEVRVMNANSQKKLSTVVFPGRSTNRNSAPRNSATPWSSPLSAHRNPSRNRNKFPRSYYYPAVQAHLDTIGHYLTTIANLPLQVTRNPSSGSPNMYSVKFSNSLPQRISANNVSLNTGEELLPSKRTMQSISANSADTLAAYATLAKQGMATPTLGFNDAPYGRHSKFDSNSQDVGKPSTIPEIALLRINAIKLSPENSSRNSYNNFTRVIFARVNNGSIHEPATEWIPSSPSLNTRHPSMPRDSAELSEYELFSVINGPTNESNFVTANTDADNSQPSNDSSRTVKYIEKLTIAHFSSPMNVNIPQGTTETKKNRLKALAKILNAPQDQDIVELKSQRNPRIKRESSTMPYDKTKYPYYNDKNKDSAIRYASNPELIPDKTKEGMAFYESKDKLMKCEDPSPPEDIIPKHDKDGEWNKNPYPENLPRIRGLGEKILCFKRKYFGENPLDNPFFQEGEIGNASTFELDSAIKSYLIREGLQASHNRSSNKRIMVMPESEESESGSFDRNVVKRIVGNQKGLISSRMHFKNHKPESASVSPSVHNLRIKSPYNNNGEHGNLYGTYGKPEGNISDAQVGESLQRNKYPYGYHPGRRKIVKKRRRPQPHHHPVSIYSVIKTNNYPYYRPAMYAHSNKNYRVIPVHDPLNDDNMASESQHKYKTKPGKYYVIRPGEFTENKDLLKSSTKGTTSIWNYVNPFRWWFPSLFDQRRKEQRYRRKKREVQSTFDDTLHSSNRHQFAKKVDTEEEIPLPANHKPEGSTTGQPISLAQFKARYNITDRPSIRSRLDMITGGFINKQAEEDTTTSSVQSTFPPSLETTTRSTIATSGKPRIIFPRTKLPNRTNGLTRKEIIERRRGQKYSTTTPAPTAAIIAPPITEPSTTRRSFVPKTKFSSKRQNIHKHLTTTTEIPKRSTESEGENTNRNNENPRKLQQVEHRRVTEEEFFKRTYLPDEDEQESREETAEQSSYSGTQINRSVEEDPSAGNETLTYLVDPATGNGSWEYLRKTGNKPKHPIGITKKPYIKKSKYHNDLNSNQNNSGPEFKVENWKTDTVEGTNSRNFYLEPQTGSEAYIMGLMSKVTPASTARNRYHVRRPNLQESIQRRQGFVPTFTAKIPLKFILEPDKRKYYYVKN